MSNCWGVPRGGAEAFRCLKDHLASLSGRCQQAVMATAAPPGNSGTAQTASATETKPAATAAASATRHRQLKPKSRLPLAPARHRLQRHRRARRMLRRRALRVSRQRRRSPRKVFDGNRLVVRKGRGEAVLNDVTDRGFENARDRRAPAAKTRPQQRKEPKQPDPAA
jgi:hypothetical protein